MNVETQRRVDRFLGVPLCLAATMLAGLSWRRRLPPGESPVRSICVMKFFGIGSIVLTAPFLAGLRAAFPKARIVYLTFSSNAETPALFPQVDRILTITTDSWRSFAIDTLRVLRTLRHDGTDIVFDLEFFSKFSTFLSTLSGARRRIGFALPTRWRSWNLTDSIPLDRTDHVATMFLRQLQVLGRPAMRVTAPPQISPQAADRQSCLAIVGPLPNGRPIVVVNVNADDTSLERRWKPERYAEAIDAIARIHPELTFFLTGTAREHSYVEGVRTRCSTPVRNLAGSLTLGEFLALLEMSTLVLSNDSGPVHLAAAVGTPVVALYGPESPEFYGPLDGSVTLYAGLACSPCLNIYTAKKFVCPYQARCMDAIAVEDVTLAVQTLLARKAAYVGVV